MFQFLVSLIVLNVFIVNTAGQLNAWNYDLDLNGKSTPSWGDSCDPSKILQSPINIIDADVMEFPYPTVLNIEMHSVKPDSISAKRETNSLDFKMKYANNQQPTLSGGPLGTDNYIFEKFHFHWTDTCTGSEHAINYKKYAAEAHLVYYNSKYANVDLAASSPNNDGLAVIAVFIELVIDEDRKDSELGKLLKIVSEFKITNTAPTIVVVPTADADKNILRISDIIQNKYFSYYGYKGTLTYPPCSRGVTWLISRDTLKLHFKDINLVKTMKGGDSDKTITKNARPLQKLGDRAVYLFSNI